MKKSLFEITEQELRREIQRAYYGFKSSRGWELFGYLEDEYCKNPNLCFNSAERETRHYFFRFCWDTCEQAIIQWNYEDGWADITMDRLVEKIMFIIKRDYQ